MRPIKKSYHTTKYEQKFEHDFEAISEEDKAKSDEKHPTNFYIGKNTVAKWKTSTSNIQVRIHSHNNIKLLPGTKGNSRNATTEIQ